MEEPVINATSSPREILIPLHLCNFWLMLTQELGYKAPHGESL